MNITQGILHAVEEGKARILTRLFPFIAVLIVILLYYNFHVFTGLNDMQSMDNAQLARQIERGAGFTTKFLRPAALAQLNAQAARTKINGKPGELFPAAKFPSGTQRILPDTYNAPGYPYLLAGWLKLFNLHFDQTAKEIALSRSYKADRAIPWLNQIFLFLTAGLTFLLGWRLFDPRVAWLAMTAFFLTDMVWQYSITAMPTNCLMFLLTGMLLVAVEIFAVGEARFESSEASFWPAWLWTLLLAVALGLLSLTRLHLLVLLLPFGLFFLSIPSRNVLLPLLLALISIGMVAPWFWSMYRISGSPIGSNVSLLHYGTDGFEGNQIYCVLAEPNYQQLFKDVTGKEFVGFGWAFAHAWGLLGTNPITVFFFASLLHTFKRPRTQALRWLILGCGFCILLANNFGVPHPANIDAWNNLILLLPGMLVMGSAFFFLLLDRLHLQLWILNNAVTTALLILVASPLIGTLLDSRGNRPYPPYSAPALHAIGDYVSKTDKPNRPDDWVTTDLPWASAWYGDHPSLWLPDTLGDFNEIYDNYNQTAMLVITPVTLGMPGSTLTSGEYKDWLPFVSGGVVPEHFPLSAHAPGGAGTIEYFIWGRPNGS